MPRSAAIADCCRHDCDTLPDSRQEGILRPDRQNQFRGRVVRAAEAALAHHQYVSATDVITGAGLLAPTHVDSWRKGRIDLLERVIQVNLKKISLSMAMFRQRALAHGLKPKETRYVRRTCTGTVDLQFSKSGDPAIEKSYRTHYVSPALSEAQTTADHRKLANAQDEPSKTIYQNALDRLQTEKSSASAK